MHNPFSSPQKWIYKYIPKHEFADKTHLIPEFLFGCIIEFVETEECFERVDYTWCASHKTFERDLRKCYQFAINTRHVLQKAIDDELTKACEKSPLVWKDVEGRDGCVELEMAPCTYDELYGEYTFFKRELYKEEQKYMKWIVKNIDHLWT